MSIIKFRQPILGLGIALGIHALQVGAVEPTCMKLSISDPQGAGDRAYIDKPGSYCLRQNMLAIKVFDVHAFSYKAFSGEGLISITHPFDSKASYPRGKDSYVIDLQGHRLVAEANGMVGIENRSGGVGVTVRNGYIEAPGNSEANRGMTLRPDWLSTKAGKGFCPLERVSCQDIPASATQGGPPLGYAKTDYLIEDITIHAGWRGVDMGGAGNILRDSIIEVDGRVAVFQFGPGAVIENTTFIIHGKGDGKPFDAALKLRDAHGAIVRNNTFIFEGSIFASAPAAINLLDSKDVLIEGNTFKGFEQKVRVNGDSTYTLK